MAIALEKQTEGVIRPRAIAAIERAGGNRERAARILEAEARKDHELFQALTRAELANSCWQAIRGAEAHLKPNTLTALQVWSDPDSKEAAEIRLREANRLSALYFWTLPNGTALGMAGWDDLDSAISHHHGLERGNRATRLWLQAIRKRIKSTQQVKDALSERILARLREEADSKAAED